MGLLDEYLVPVGRGNLCFDCERACGGCSWSRSFTPVPGWTAKKTVRSSTHGTDRVFLESYDITACPLFVPTPPRGTPGESGPDERWEEYP